MMIGCLSWETEAEQDWEASLPLLLQQMTMALHWTLELDILEQVLPMC
jgi:hypothetical protein